MQKIWSALSHIRVPLRASYFLARDTTYKGDEEQVVGDRVALTECTTCDAGLRESHTKDGCLSRHKKGPRQSGTVHPTDHP